MKIKQTLMGVLLFFVCLGGVPLGRTQQVESTDVKENVNARYLQGRTWADYKATAGAALTLNIAAGTSWCNGTLVTYAGGTLTMGNTTNYIYLDTSASCVPAVTTGAYPTSGIPIATVVATAGAITTVTDRRSPLSSNRSLGILDVSTFATGGVGTSVSPWTSASGSGGILEAFNALPATGGHLHMSAGYYSVTTAFTLTGKNFTLTCAGIGKAIIDATTLAVGPAITVQGTLTTLAGTTSGATAEGAATFTVSDATGISQWDWLLVRPNHAPVGTVTRTLGSPVIAGVGTHFDTEFVNGDVIKISGSRFYTILTVDSAVQVTLTANVAEANGAGLSYWRGSDFWNSSRDYYFKGEWLKVQAVSGTTITPEHVTWDSYVTGTPIYRLDGVTVDISGFELRGNAVIAGLVVDQSINSRVHDIKVAGMRERGMGLYYNVGTKAYNNVVEDVSSVATGTNYGVSLSNSHEAEVFNNTLDTGTGRRAFTLGSDGNGGVSRLIHVHDNYLRGGVGADALDAHGIAEHYTYEHNFIDGGVDLAGRFGVLRDNTIFSSKTTGITLLFYEPKTWDVIVEANRFFCDKTPTGTACIQGSGSDLSSDGGGKFQFEHNTVRMYPTGNMFEPWAAGSGETIDAVLINGNRFISTAAQTATKTTRNSVAIRFDSGTIKEIQFQNNYSVGCRLYIVGNTTSPFDSVTVAHNRSFRSHWMGMYIQDFKFLSLLDNDVSYANGDGIWMQPTTPFTIQADQNRIYNNGVDALLAATDRVGLHLYGTAAGSLFLRNNSLFDNQAVPTQQYGAYLRNTGATNFYPSQNNYFGNATAQRTLYSTQITVMKPFGDSGVDGYLEAVNPTVLGSESLTDGTFTAEPGAGKWTVTGGWDAAFTGNTANYSAAAGSLTQAAADLAVAGVGYRWYKFAYTVTVPVGTIGATITTGFASAAVTLPLTAGAQTVYFRSNAAPAAFVIAATGTGSFTIDGLSLMEMQGGNVIANGKLTGGGTSGLKILGDGNFNIDKLALTYNSIGTVGNGVPAEYASADLTAQTAAIAATTIYAVPATGVGMYRISWSAKVTTAGTTSSTLGGAGGFQVVYTDANDSVAVTPLTVPNAVATGNTTQTQLSGVVIVYAKASTNIQYVFGYTDGGGAQLMTYSLHVKVEKM